MCDPRNGNASFGLGALEAYHHRAARARHLFLVAARDAGSRHAFAKAHAALGRLAEDGGRVADAVKEYRQALRADGHNVWARSGLARVLIPRQRGG
jgi:Flp pilus assembly protein TadD